MDGPTRGAVDAIEDEPAFHSGERIRIAARSAIGNYRVPIYLRGKQGTVESLIEADDATDEGGRGAGSPCHYYRVAMLMSELWPDYTGSPRDGLRVEVFETWLERI